MKHRGRGIWVGIVSANSEREPLGLQSLWPGTIYGTNNVAAKAQDYFNYLMSNGSVVTNAMYTVSAQNRVVGDLNSTTLSGAGVASYTGIDGQRVPSNFMAWHAVLVTDSSASEDAFLITKNLKLASDATGNPLDNSATPSVTFAGIAAPFGNTHGVWVTRGGGSFDARPRYLTLDRVNGAETNAALKCDDANPDS
jgi:hypothetical protein